MTQLQQLSRLVVSLGCVRCPAAINETPRVFVERIDVNGNVRTLDKVVRRELALVEGDPVSGEDDGGD